MHPPLKLFALEVERFITEFVEYSGCQNWGLVDFMSETLRGLLNL